MIDDMAGPGSASWNEIAALEMIGCVDATNVYTCMPSGLWIQEYLKDQIL